MVARRFLLLFMLLSLFVILAGCKDDIYSASEKGKSDTLKLLISEGHDINKRNRKGKLPIFFAIQNGQIDIVKILIENGADLTLQDQYAGAPLHNAAFIGDIEIAKLLLAAGADINAISKRTEYTPICYAVIRGKVEMLKFLLEKGADTNIKMGYYESTLLHVSVANISNPMETTKILLDIGTDVNALDKKGKTPLHVVACSIWTGPKTANMARLLIDRGARKELKDNEGKTALDYARVKNKIEVIQILDEK